MKRSAVAVGISTIIGLVCAGSGFVRNAVSSEPAGGTLLAAAPAAGGRGAVAPPAFGGGFGGRRGGRGAPPGPPAPVPPEVAAPHPTADEVARLNAALKRIAETDTSPDGPLLKKYESLLTVPPSRPNPCIAPVPRNAQRHAEFVKIAEKGDIDLLLEGDSITDWWINPPPRPAPGEAANPAEVPVGKPTAAYTKYFGNIKTADFAIAGDTTQGVLWGLQNGEGKGFQPKAIMLMIGTNNMGTCSAAEIAEGVGAIVLENRKDFPNAKILLLAIFPRSVPTDPVRTKIAETNQIISKLNDGQHVFYMDIGSKFLDERGYFLPDAFRGDNLHPQEKGYDIWGAAVIDKLKEFLK